METEIVLRENHVAIRDRGGKLGGWKRRENFGRFSFDEIIGLGIVGLVLGLVVLGFGRVVRLALPGIEERGRGC